MGLLVTGVAIAIRILIAATHEVQNENRKRHYKPAVIKRRRTMKWTLFKTKLSYANNLFNGHFVDVKAFYAARFNRLACVSFIGEIDITQAFNFVMQHCSDDIVDTYQHSYFNHDEQKVYFNNTVIVLTQKRVVEIAGNYCQVLHTPDGYDWARWLMKELANFRVMTANMQQTTAYTKVTGFAGAAELN